MNGLHSFKPCARSFLLVALLALGGCATKEMPGYQNTYQGYTVPEQLVARVNAKFREHGLTQATTTKDSVGRVRLAGAYRNEDDVDAAFTIAQSIVGIKSTSPFYPENVQEKRWERDAGRALAAFAASQQGSRGGPGTRRALIIGINAFADSRIGLINGEDDARVVAAQLTKYGYKVTSLFGQQATKARIERAISDLEKELGPDDALFIYVSSHGAPPLPTPAGGDGRKMSVIAYDTGDTAGRRSRDHVDYALNVQRTSVKDSLFQQLAQRPTRVTRVLIDTCYSGEILKDVPEDSRRFILERNGGQPEREGISIASWSTGAGVSSKGIQYVGASQATAAASPFQSRQNYTVITATSEGQLSWGPTGGKFQAPVGNSAQKDLNGSFFTQTFAAWLEVHNGQIVPAFEQASAFTSRKVSIEKGGTEKQTPRMFSTVPNTQDNLIKF
jgi:hypothetical protein